MEEEKKSNKKVFYLVLGIVLSVGLTIGGTYAYFSASKTATGTQITGTTNDVSGLSITTARVNLSPSPAPASDNLVPADFGVQPTAMTTTEVNRALTNKCVDSGYTGCHVWKITASSSQTIPSANIELSLSLIDVEDKDDWAYIVYEGTDTSSSNIVHKGNIITDFPNGASLDIHSGGSITGGTPKVYYVMVYLNNVNSSQNDGTTSGTTDARGTYNGTATLKAMGGEVKVDFIDRTTPAEFFEYIIENNEVTITGYRKLVATYTVSDQSACESYLVNMGDSSENAATLCNGGSVKVYTLGDAITDGEIPSSDYSTAGLSNVVITKAPTDVVIPSTIEGYPVTAIGSIAFLRAGLTSVVIPSSVTNIGDGAFESNQITSVEIPSSVTTIGERAFYGNPLTSITIKNKSVIMDNCAFTACGELLSEPFLSNYSCNACK